LATLLKWESEHMKKIKYIVRLSLYYFFRLFPVKKSKIFFQNFNGKGYGDNPKYIVEEILRRGLDFELVWAAAPESRKNFPRAVRTVKHKSLRAAYEEATAGIWVDNCRKQLYVRKRKDQFYIQTWHGGPTFVLKKVENDAGESLDKYYKKQIKHDSLLIDLFLCCEKNKKEAYKSTFEYGGDILECGSPCDDLFFLRKDGIKENFLESFSISKSTKIVLYAPTFRNVFDLASFNINYQAVLDFLRKKTGDDWAFLVRLHPNISQKASFMTYNERIINATHYDDMQELMYASDMLISDYSGVIIEFAMMKKPVFLYAKDYDSYIRERDFYVDYFSLPFPIAMSNDELLDKIKCFDAQNYEKELDSFFERIGVLDDGGAAKRVIDRITMKLQKE
jgi:CDP-glycerol glycerophosphotransferase